MVDTKHELTLIPDGDVTIRSSQTLGSGEVHLWYLEPDGLSGEQLEAYKSLLSPSEWRRYERYKLQRARDHFVLGRALLRTTLSRYADRDPRDWRIVRAESGRPELADPDAPPWRFSLSHTDGLVALALTLDRNIGVDAENIGRELRSMDIARRILPPDVLHGFDALSAQRQQRLFFEHWTLKESYLKACGLGLRLPLDRFWFALDQDRPIRISFDPRVEDDPSAWQFAQFWPTPVHCMSSAVQRRNGPDLHIRVRPTVPVAERRRRPS